MSMSQGKNRRSGGGKSGGRGEEVEGVEEEVEEEEGVVGGVSVKEKFSRIIII